MDAITKAQALEQISRKIREMRRYEDQRRFIRIHKLGVSQATLSRWESGVQAPPIHVLINLGIIEIK